MLATLNLNKEISARQYARDLLRYQLQLRDLAYQLYQRKRSLMVVYEGWDAAGKGGNIRRVVEKLDPRGYEVFPIAAPAGDDKIHHYLWRFWRRLEPPDEKQILIFDRSWYGRVLVERVEGFCSEAAWKRAYREINEFESQLVDAGGTVVKFWLQLSKEEQLRRFEQREHTSWKQWKLTEEDWRNREKWDHYAAAVEEMLLKTSTSIAPWTVVEANFKWFARVKCLKTLVESLSRSLDYKPANPVS
jgi:polyphosphate kinase 2 (PPK2 family)